MADDLRQRVLDLLAALGLRSAAANFDALLPNDLRKRAAALETMERILRAENDDQVLRRIERRLSASRLPERPTFEAFDFDFQPGLDRVLVMDLATLAWVDRKEDLVILGQSGTGKSHIGKALCMIAACQQRWVRYTTCADMLAELYASMADQTLPRALRAYTRPTLLLIDDLGYDPIEQEQAREAQLLYKVLEVRHQKVSTIITSNLPAEKWADYLGDHYLTVALLDRLLYHGTVISIEGPSWRFEQHKKRQARPSTPAQPRGSTPPK